MHQKKNISKKKSSNNNNILNITLDAKHNEILAEFSERSKNIVSLNDELKKLKQQIKRFESKELFNLSEKERLRKFNLENKIAEISEEIYGIQNNVHENEYCLKTMGHLLDYHQQNKNRGDIFEEYLHTIDPNYIPRNKIESRGDTYCKLCNNKMILNHLNGTLECYNCGATEYTLVEDSRQNYNEGIIPQDNNCFSYKKITHLMECIEQCQGKERTEIPKEVFDKLLEKIRSERIEHKTSLTNDKIKEYLKELNLNSYYEHVPYIQTKLKGQQPPDIPPYLEERIIKMFKDVQIAFKKCRPEERKNFPSYSYVLHKCIQNIGDHDEFLDKFPLFSSKYLDYKD